MSCSVGAFNAAYHTKIGVYHHEMGIKKGGKLVIMAGAGPMGLSALTYALHRDVRPSMVVVTDVNEDRLARSEALFPPAEVKEKDGIDLHFVNTDKQFSAKMNFYDVHYNSTHVMGTTGGNTADMIESLELTASGRIDPAVMVTHIGGLDAAAETTLNLPKIPGGKKLIYSHLTMPLTALADIVDAHNGLWCPEAEEYLLANFQQHD